MMNKVVIETILQGSNEDYKEFKCRSMAEAKRIKAQCAIAPKMFKVLQRIAAEVDGLDMSAELWEELHKTICKGLGAE